MKSIKWPPLPSKKEIIPFLSGLLEKGLVLAVIGYIAVSVSRSVMKNYQINQRINDLHQKIAQLEQERIYLNNLIAYYKTDTFKELKAREELGLQKPGEHVLSVPVEPDDQPVSTEQDSFITQNVPQEETPLPNYTKWYNYFFQ